MLDYINEFPLLKWFEKACKKHRNSKFPGSGSNNYWAIFVSVHEYLNNHVHPMVESAAAAAEPSLFLTRHGPEHIKVVIQRAQNLIATSKWLEKGGTYNQCLEPYETFVLLMAIHFHDLANRSGRSGHERRIKEEVAKIEAVQQIGRFHLDEIIKIASCHGGKIDGNADKIGIMLSPISHSGLISYRPQLIAAVLKLADELADDSTRADIHGLKSPDKFPKNSLLFHKYAAALETVWLEAPASMIKLYFKFTKKDAKNKFPKPVDDSKCKDVYLLDYIYERTLKTYRELFYCTRFMRQLQVNYHGVKVCIEVFPDDDDDTSINEVSASARIEYVIGNTGYPDDRHGNLEALSNNFDPKLTGAVLAKRLNSQTSV